MEASLQSFASLLKAEKADARLGVKWGTRTIGSAEQIPQIQFAGVKIVMNENKC